MVKTACEQGGSQRASSKIANNSSELLAILALSEVATAQKYSASF